MICRLSSPYVTAVQWVPENADAVIEELKQGGQHADDMEVNGFNLILWAGSGTMNWSVNPGQWIILVCGQPIIVDESRIGEHIDYLPAKR